MRRTFFVTCMFCELRLIDRWLVRRSEFKSYGCEYSYKNSNSPIQSILELCRRPETMGVWWSSIIVFFPRCLLPPLRLASKTNGRQSLDDVHSYCNATINVYRSFYIDFLNSNHSTYSFAMGKWK